jgi:hypothetical protein
LHYSYIDIQLHCCWLLHEQAHRNQQAVARWSFFIIFFATRNACLVNTEMNISTEMFPL